MFIVSARVRSSAAPASRTNTTAPSTITTNLTQPSPSVPRSNLIAQFQTKRGFRIELVASDPLVCAPAAMAFDESGRLFVAEMRDYPDKRNQTPHLGRIRMLQDTDGDGLYDASTIYADELPSPSAIICYGGGVFVAAGPDILYFKDTAKNGLADQRRIVLSGFGEPGARGPQDPVFPNNFQWGLDNRIHGAAGEFGGKLQTSSGGDLFVGNNGFSFDPGSSSFSLESGAADSGCAFDDRGRKFVCDLVHPLRAVMYEKRYAGRNLYLPAPLPVAEAISPAAPIFRFSGAPGAAARPANVGAAGSFIVADSWKQARGLASYRGNAFAPTFLDNVFIPDASAHVVHRAILRDNGLDVVAEPSPDELNTEFLLSRDPSFRPVQIVNGPDGALYIADMMTAGDSGRIFRILPEATKPGRPRLLAGANTYELVSALASQNGWHRETAARLLIERHDPSAIPLLTAMLNNSRLAYARLQALCALDGLNGLTEAAITKGLNDLDEAVRERAVLLTEKIAQNGPVSDAVWTRLKFLAGDLSPRVRYQLCWTIGQINRPERSEVLASVFSHNPENPWLQAALLSSGSQGGADLLIALASGPGWADPANPNIISRLALSIGLQRRSGDAESIINFVSRGSLSQQRAFTVLYALGEGLHRAGGSLAAADPQNRLQQFYDQCLEVTLNDTFSDNVRLPAIQFRGVTPYADFASGDILQLLFGTRQSPAIQTAALSTLAHYANPAGARSIIQRWADFPEPVRARAVEAMLTRGDWVEQIIAALESGQISLNSFASWQLDLLRNWPEQRLAERVTKLIGPTAIHRPDVLAQFAGATRMPGSGQRGRDIFIARCVSCHRASDGRQPMALDLAHVKTYSRDRVLAAIIEPNAEIRAQWATHFVQTKQSEVWIGLLADDNPTTLTLLIPGHEPAVLPHDNLHYIQQEPWSLMPAGLENGLSEQNMADLLEYLCPR